MQISQHMNETLTLRKKSTGHVHTFRAFVGRDMIMTNNGNLPVEEGDTIERPLPTSVEYYTVVDRGYMAATRTTPAHYQMKVTKNTGEAASRHQSGSVTNIYNLSGTQARVNVQSVDRSVNVSSVTTEQLFAEIASTIKQKVSDEKQKTEMLQTLDALKRADSETIGEKYREFISTAADHMALLTPFLPALTAMLIK